MVKFLLSGLGEALSKGLMDCEAPFLLPDPSEQCFRPDVGLEGLMKPPKMDDSV